jgi:hypothetical protein
MQTRYALTLIQNALIGAIWRNWRNTGGLQLAAYQADRHIFPKAEHA